MLNNIRNQLRKFIVVKYYIGTDRIDKMLVKNDKEFKVLELIR